MPAEFRNWNYLSLLVISEDVLSNNTELNQKQPLTSNIPSAIITNDKSLTAIFLFKLEESTSTPLFSKATLEEKPITVMYTDAKVDGYFIKSILDIDCAASARIIMANGETKTPIGKIDNFSFEVNGIITSIKYQALVGNDWLVKTNTVLNWNTQKLQLKAYQVFWVNTKYNKLPPVFSWNNKEKEKKEDTPEKDTTIEEITRPITTASHAIENAIVTQRNRENGTMNNVLLAANSYLMKECGTTFLVKKECAMLYVNKIWGIVNAKVKGVMPSKILEIKNNLPKPVDIIFIPNPDAFLNIETGSEEFYKHYQNLAPTKKEQEQCLKKINTQLCDYCLILCDF
ncbi:hypothetical protein G9A89_017846 [Geosiphon pyriformis]|nr:hypothetical protein G9A89_017846 [Geosiphon pyriformis]